MQALTVQVALGSTHGFDEFGVHALPTTHGVHTDTGGLELVQTPPVQGSPGLL